jgi:hypothetical protein
MRAIASPTVCAALMSSAFGSPSPAETFGGFVDFRFASSRRRAPLQLAPEVAAHAREGRRVAKVGPRSLRSADAPLRFE